jgi:hypothetical protein
MMRVVCYLEDNFGVVCKPVSFPLLKNSLEMFLWNSKDQEKDPEMDFIKVERFLFFKGIEVLKV